MDAPCEYGLLLSNNDEVVVFDIDSRCDHIAFSKETPVRWRLQDEAKSSWWKPAKKVEKRFVQAIDGSELRIRRIRRFPSPRFAISQKDQLIGSIHAQNPFRTHYRIRLGNEPDLELRMPLFRTLFVVSSGGREIARVRKVRGAFWAVRFQPQEARAELVAAITRIFYARWYAE